MNCHDEILLLTETKPANHHSLQHSDLNPNNVR
jgi:hypothetical protein